MTKETVLIYPPHQKAGKLLAIGLGLVMSFVLTIVIVKSDAEPGSALLGISLLVALVSYLYHLIGHEQLSFSLTDMHIQHHSRRGGWSLKWNNVAQIGIPSVSSQGWHQTMPWVGVKIKNYEPLLDCIGYRLASHIITEQRGLLLIAYRKHENKLTKKIEDMMYDDTPYVSESGKTYKGLMAMMANRMMYSRDLLGFDLFINEDLLDRPLADFVGMTRQYLASAGEDTPTEKIN